MTLANGWKTVARAEELPPLSLKHVEVEGKEIAVINFEGTYYAVSDRCGHMNAPLSRGQLRSVQGKNIIVCPLHGSTFDVLTGRNLAGPVKSPPLDLSGLPQATRDMFVRAAELSALIKVHDLDVFEVKRDGDDIKLNWNSKRESVVS